ncbi:sugar synthetase [Meiothermus sp. CFH 77666]|uniref:sugar synthetase n=1 Tax=Meiothermus sp. CFH 77666 TaxID=2817942 RepID=UPI001AA00EFE|nr:sugar synthetase [Meiothermus sp. CFH 77666]MBO1437662.1 sugar synthetase [Meiothermus sp. CFH 77666]
MLDEILLLTNGPGELSTWVPPVLSRLRREAPRARIELFLIRDQFAAGTEQAKARELALEAISGRSALVRRLLRGKARGRGLVLMLGGAPRDAVLLGRATGYPAFSYTFDAKAHHPGLRAVLVDSERTKSAMQARGADPSRVVVVGNLVVDALNEAPPQPTQPADVLLFAGSRPFAARYLLGFLLAAAEQMAAQRPGLRFAWVRSRLLPEAVVAEALQAHLVQDIGGVGASWAGRGLRTQHGLEVAVLDEPERYAAMRLASLAITIPGTNTLELALAGLPSLVLLPLHKPEMLPLEGIWHWLLSLPGARPFKQQFVRGLVSRIPHLALPNQWLGERVFPELRGVFRPTEVAVAGLELLAPQRAQEVRAKLERLEARPGADKLVAYVLANC